MGQTIGQLGARGPGRGDGGGINQALSNFLQTFQSGAKNLLSVMQAQQTENAQANQEARQSAASGVSEVLNQVASGVRAKDQTDHSQQTKEERDYAEQVALWTKELQEDAQKKAASIQQAIKAQEDGRVNYVNRHKQELAVLGDSNIANRTKLEGMADWIMDLPDGPAMYVKAMRSLEHSESLYESHQNAPFAAYANQITNEMLAKIYESEDPTGNLRELQLIDPRLQPLPAVKQEVGEPQFIDDWKELLDWEQGQGYPSHGVQHLAPDDPKMRHVVPYTSASALKAMMDDSYIQLLMTKKARQALKDSLTTQVDKADTAIEPILAAEKSFRDVFTQVAPEAINRGIQDYMADTDPHKRDNMPDTLVKKILAHMVPEHGPAFAKMAFDVRDGNVELKDQKDGYHALAIKAATSALRERLLMAQAEPFGPMMTTIFKDITTHPMGTVKALAQFGMGVQTSGMGLRTSGQLTLDNNAIAAGIKKTWGLFAEMGASASRIRDAVKEQIPVQQLYSEAGTVRRLADTYTLVGPSIDNSPDNLMTPEEARRAMEEVSQKTEPSEAYRRNLGLLEATAVLLKNAPDKMGGLMELLNGGDIQIRDPNLPSFQTAVDEARKTDPLLDKRIQRRVGQWNEESEAKKAAYPPTEPPGLAGQAGMVAGDVAGRAVEGSKKIGRGVGQAAEAVGEAASAVGQAIAKPAKEAGGGFMEAFKQTGGG